MCGIAGIHAYGAAAPAVDREELLRVREAMRLRGPDGAGLWMSADQRAGLAHRRLSIIDLSQAGAQPMSSADGRLYVTFNGEIYNYRELRRQLEERGCRFQSATDTEVLLHLYAERGAEMVHCLRGMYAFAIYDTLRGSLFLARDPFGIKPLYYADDGKTFRFASQVKALLKGNVDSAPAPAGHVGFFIWGHVPEPHTLYRGIKALPAGSTLEISGGAVAAPRAFFSIAEELKQADAGARPASREEASELLHEAMRDSVQHHLVADVPVGLFLSAGLDSGVLAGLATDAGMQKLRTVTLGFEEYRGSRDDETGLAEMVARHFGTEHRTRWIGPGDFSAERERLLEAMDQPSIDGVNTYFVSRAMAECGVKVALSGLGGDELFGSYPSFRDLPRMVRFFGLGPPGRAAGRALRGLLDPALRLFTSPKFAGLMEYGGSFSGAYLLRRSLYMPWELPGFLDEQVVRAGLEELQPLACLEETIRGLRSAHQKVSALELTWYMRNQLLRDSDWAGMAHAVEIRVPLVDPALFRVVARLLPGGGLTKRDMADAPARALPQAVLDKTKTGFAVPMREWVRRRHGRLSGMRGLRGWAQELDPVCRKPKRVLALLTDAYGGRGGISKFNRDFLEAICGDPGCREVVALPRVLRDPPGPMPGKLRYVTSAAANKFMYLAELWATLAARGRFDLVMCCHINLLPVAWLASLWHRVPLLLTIHGIDAWQPNRSSLTNLLVPRIDAFAAVSGLTLQRFLEWSRVDPRKGVVLPNSVDLSAYCAKPKSETLLARFGLQGRRLLMTVGRLVSSERYKGFDEVIEALPELSRIHPDIAYLIVGEGSDRERLEEKARECGVADRVVFAGYVAESEKCDFYNLADAFVMPSRGEGFGIVFLEAMACGVPVVGSLLDGSREALRDGMLGILVDPTDAASVRSGILEALERPRSIPQGLDYFSVESFNNRTRELLGVW